MNKKTHGWNNPLKNCSYKKIQLKGQKIPQKKTCKNHLNYFPQQKNILLQCSPAIEAAKWHKGNQNLMAFFLLFFDEKKITKIQWISAKSIKMPWNEMKLHEIESNKYTYI